MYGMAAVCPVRGISRDLQMYVCNPSTGLFPANTLLRLLRSLVLGRCPVHHFRRGPAQLCR